MSDAITPQQRADLLQRIHTSRAALDQTIAGLSEQQLATPGPDGGWSVKDHLAHLAAWERKLLAIIQGQPGYVGLQVDPATYEHSDIDELNAILHERFRALSPAAALAASRQSYEQLMAAIGRLSAADLGAPYAPGDPDDHRRIFDGIVDNTYAHYDEHCAAIEAIAGHL